MICEHCRLWCVRTTAAWSNRQRNMRAAPDVAVHACPHCGGTEWATTTQFIAMPEPKRSGLHLGRLLLIVAGAGVLVLFALWG